MKWIQYGNLFIASNQDDITNLINLTHLYKFFFFFNKKTKTNQEFNITKEHWWKGTIRDEEASVYNQKNESLEISHHLNPAMCAFQPAIHN